MSKCLCCGEGAKVPASELFGATFKEHEGCVSYTMHSSPCGSTNVCVCMYCAGCPFWGWDMCVCKTDDAGDCYLGVAGSSLFVMTVVSKDEIWPNGCECAKALRVPAPEEGMSRS